MANPLLIFVHIHLADYCMYFCAGGLDANSGGGEEKGSKRRKELRADEIDLRAYRPAGKLFLMELLKMPPETKVSRNWKIRQGNCVNAALISREIIIGMIMKGSV